MKTKLCPTCQTDKEISAFGLNKSRKDGLSQDCKECRNRYNYKRYPQTKHRLRLIERQYQQRLRLRAVAVLGNRCVKCGFSDPRALQIDHIDGGGNKEARSGGRPSIYRKIVRGNTDGYQLLCANHNWIKRAENNESPYRGRP